MLTTAEIAEKLNVTPKTVRTLIENGDIKAIRIGKLYRVTKEEFDFFLEKNKINNE